MLKYQDFIDQYSPKHGGLAKKIAIFMEDREISSLMGDELYECFGTKTAIGKTQFYRYRNVLIDFVEFTKDSSKDKIINRISNITQVQLAKHIDEKSSTYSNLDELLELIGQIVSENKLHSTDATPLQSMAILLWLNYSNEDIAEFKISDIDNLDNIDNKYQEILKTYAGLKYYRALPTGRVQNLIQSKYLFRTANTDKLTVLDVKQIITKINRFLAEKNRSFSRAILERSVAFIEMYKNYKQDITPEIIRSYFYQSMKTAEVEKLIVEYKNWVKQF